MIEFEEYAAFLKAAADRARVVLLEAGIKIAAYQHELAVKEIIGHELPMWPPLEPETVEEKEREGYTGQVSETDPLLRTGDLRESVKAVVEPTPVGIEITIGSNDPAAAPQELGTSTIPPRPFLATATMAAMEFAEEELAAEAALLLIPPEKSAIIRRPVETPPSSLTIPDDLNTIPDFLRRT